MVIFKYIEDKDVFQTFYSTKLSKRLIHGVSASEEAEASMISKLKEACGFEYTNKLQRMFTGAQTFFLISNSTCASERFYLSRTIFIYLDMSLSKDLTQQFKERQETAPDPDDISFSVMVLGTNFWPLTPPSHQFNIPEDLNKTYNRFQLYYQSKHSYVHFSLLL